MLIREMEEFVNISARNVLPGTVQAVTKGAVNGEVMLALQGGEEIVSIITNGSVDSLQLAQGKKAFAVIKASDVMSGKGLEGAKLSARNVLPAVVSRLDPGAVNSEVQVSLAGRTVVVASITKSSVEALGLKVGDKVSAIVKASHVMIGT